MQAGEVSDWMKEIIEPRLTLRTWINMLIIFIRVAFNLVRTGHSNFVVSVKYPLNRLALISGKDHLSWVRHVSVEVNEW